MQERTSSSCIQALVTLTCSWRSFRKELPLDPLETLIISLEMRNVDTSMAAVGTKTISVDAEMSV